MNIVPAHMRIQSSGGVGDNNANKHKICQVFLNAKKKNKVD